MDKDNKVVDMDKQLIEEAEWCFQFDEDEPQIIAVSPSEKKGEELTVSFSIANKSKSALTFTQDGKKFTLFARPITEDGRRFQEEQSKLIKQQQENASKD